MNKLWMIKNKLLKIKLNEKTKMDEPKMNKRALEDSLFTWIATFLVIVFIMIIYFLFVLFLFGEEKLTEDIDIVFEESRVELNLNSKFLGFLSSNVFIDGKEKKTINVIKNSLDPYFEIKNDKGESFVEKYGLMALKEEGVALKNKMRSGGFDDNDWDKLIQTNFEFQESGGVKEIIKKLDKFCDIDREDRYHLEIPQGSINGRGFRANEEFNPENNFYYTQPIIHKTNYRGENIEIKFRMRKECVN